MNWDLLLIPAPLHYKASFSIEYQICLGKQRLYFESVSAIMIAKKANLTADLAPVIAVDAGG
jgi:hypothetical protein